MRHCCCDTRVPSSTYSCGKQGVPEQDVSVNERGKHARLITSLQAAGSLRTGYAKKHRPRDAHLFWFKAYVIRVRYGTVRGRPGLSPYVAWDTCGRHVVVALRDVLLLMGRVWWKVALGACHVGRALQGDCALFPMYRGVFSP